MTIIPPNGYNAALYLRLSRDEDTKSESNSITNQRQILTDYAAQNGYRVAGEYVDDGISGVTFERRGFQEMLSMIEAGEIERVIVKDAYVKLRISQI
jgi:DNA invertase Pin-like site-specific DNA recombinase